MGAIEFRHEVYAYSPRDAYDTLVREAIRYNGEDRYNGTISTTDGFRTVKFNGKNLGKFENECLEDCGKREAICIDLGVTAYDRISIKKSKSRVYGCEYRYKTMYVLKGIKDDEAFMLEKSDSKRALESKIGKYLDRYECVFVSKEPVAVEKKADGVCYSYDAKRFKSKPKATKDTVKIAEVHRYIFVGLAAW